MTRIHSFFIKIVFFRPKLEHSHFSDDFRVKILLSHSNISDFDDVEAILEQNYRQ